MFYSGPREGLPERHQLPREAVSSSHGYESNVLIFKFQKSALKNIKIQDQAVIKLIQ